MTTSAGKPKIAILGGGMAALTAAFALAKTKQYEITVFQQGWRLGGKGASGRNASRHGRIEEHGLHIWFGAYDNAFATMTDVYSHVPGVWPYGKVANAFRPQHGFQLMERPGGVWKVWPFSMPSSSRVPGNSTPRGVIDAIRQWLPAHVASSNLHGQVARIADYAPAAAHFSPSRVPLNVEFLKSLAERPIGGLDEPDLRALCDSYGAFASATWDRLGPVLSGHRPVNILSSVLDFDDLRRAWVLFDIGQAVFRGAVEDGIVDSGDWDEINRFELRDWLSRWIIDRSSLESAPILIIYDLFFSYPRGNAAAPGAIEAGTAVRAALWLLTGYRGSVMWRMNSGMGDTIFAPLYHALVALDVKFRFFQKVVSLVPSADGAQIASIGIERQAQVRAGEECYQPFVKDRTGRDCWPSVPNFCQLYEGTDLCDGWEQFNLESDWSQWKGTAYEIHLGIHFDKVVLGIPIAALPGICHALVYPANPKSAHWAQMLSAVQTVQTQAFQVWLDCSLDDLNSPLSGTGEPPAVSTFCEPVDTYADMTYLLDGESWPDPKPRHVAYFCGVKPDVLSVNPPHSERGFARRATKEVAGLGISMLKQEMSVMWPAAYAGGGIFRWNLLCGSSASGEARFQDQFWRANIDWSERYVLALPGTSVARLDADGSGYSNLLLAGDWTRNGLYVGCIEGAVISGLRAARAAGVQVTIEGEGELFK